MVSGKMKVAKLFGWHTIFEYTHEEGDFFINYYLPDGKTMLKIKLDSPSIQTLKTIRDQIVALMQQDVTLSGAVIEKWEKQPVTKPAETIEDWVQTA